MELDDVQVDLINKASKKPQPDRDVWSNRFEYLLGLIGFTIGLGSIWRFPYLCMKNGGGAFLVPFFFFTLLCGVPLYFLELTLGQFSGQSAVIAWSLCPLFEGIGYSVTMLSMLGAWYYGPIVAWILLYFVYSFFPTQPWSTCDNTWNTNQCIEVRAGGPAGTNSTGNLSIQTNVSVTHEGFYPTAATEFWRYKILNTSSGIEEWGTPQWHLIVALFFSYASTFLCIIRGVKSVGKVVYVTALGPFVLLIVILIRSLCLEGSMDGVILYLTPDFSKLLSYQIWLEAALQVFYSLGPVWGGVITMASYHKFRGNIMRDTIIIVAVDTFSNFLCGLVVFSILGFLAHDAGLSISEVAESGPGLVFLVYPEVLTRLPLPQLWAILFFFMLFMVGLDSQFGSVETFISALMDVFPNTLGKRKYHVIGTVFFLYFSTSIIFSTNGAVYIFQFIDWYLSAFIIFLVAFLECVIAGWIYGAERLSRDIQLMTGSSVSVFVRISWGFIIPSVMLIAGITVAVKFERPVYRGYVYPAYISVAGMFVALLLVIPIPVVMVKRLLERPGSFAQRLRMSVVPSPDWRPHDEKERLTYKQYQYRGSIWQNLKTNMRGTSK
ncbi:sodium-dependent proline transporter-like [Ylistrum balloti]|uniref:sodium-dependent proline transporter-like n=1 Tax=Ylistrum balloti TaxID=509963 RepID=UPI002905D239|nr:sodium-dependent proline transporter-like [Ylistrum balloti]